MKKMVCEVCESTDIIKTGEYFECQVCGCKYSAEAIRRMLYGAESEVTVQALQQKLNESEIEQKIGRMKSQFEQGNYSTVRVLYEEILEADRTNREALVYKAYVLGWETTLAKSNLPTASVKLQELACMDRGMHADEEGFTKTCIPQMREFAKIMEAYFKTMKKYNAEKSAEYARWVGEAEKANQEMKENIAYHDAFMIIKKRFELCLEKAKAIDAERVSTYNNGCSNASAAYFEYLNYIIKEIKDPATVCDEFYNELYKAVNVCNGFLVTRTLEDDFRKIHHFISESKILFVKFQAKAKEERITAYWEENPEKKAELEQELKEVTDELDRIQAKLVELEGADGKKIDELRKERDKGVVPSEKDRVDCEARIASLNTTLQGLGMFKGKEKKEIQAQINKEVMDLREIKTRVEQEKKALAEEMNKKVSFIKEQSGPLREKMAELKKRKESLEFELNGTAL